MGEEVRRRVDNAVKTTPTPPQDTNTPESALQPGKNAEEEPGSPDVSVTGSPAEAPKRPVAPPQAVARSLVAKLPQADLVIAHLRNEHTRMNLGGWVTKRHGRLIWDLLVESITSGAFGPPTTASISKPNLRLVLPWVSAQGYAARFDLFDAAIRTQIQRDILPLVVANRDLLDHPEQLPELVRKAAEAHREEARRTHAVQRQAAAVAQLPITERQVLVYGHSLWPPPPPTIVAWSYTEACEAAWFFRLFQQLFHHIESPASVAQTATMFLRWTPMRASGWAEAVRKIAWAYTEQPEGPCDIPPIPPNYGM